MKILLASNFTDRLGGAHSAFKSSAALLKAEGHDVATLTFDADVNSYFIKRYGLFYRVIHLVFYPIFYIFNPFVYFRTKAILKISRPDIVHVHLYIGRLTSAVLIAAKKANIPVVHTVHDYRTVCAANAMLDSKGRICDKCISNSSSVIKNRCARGSLALSLMVWAEQTFRLSIIDKQQKLINGWIFVSDFCRSKHTAKFGRRMQNETIIPNFIPKEYMSPPSSGTKRTGLVYVGRLSHEKGILEAVETITKSDLDLTITLIGTGPQHQEIKKIASRDERIVCLGQMPRAEVVKAISSSQYSVVPSRWYENNPLSVLDSFATGTPVIASKIGGIPEIVRENKTGFLFDPFSSASLIETIQQALSITATEYAFYQNQCYKAADLEFSEKHQLNRLMEYYQKVSSDR